MTNQQDSKGDNNRSKLTLKLKPVDAEKKPILSKSLTVKSSDRKRGSYSSVQVTIKGRKSSINNLIDRASKASGLNRSEIEARRDALKNTADDKDIATSTHKILSKANKQKSEQEQEKKIAKDHLKNLEDQGQEIDIVAAKDDVQASGQNLSVNQSEQQAESSSQNNDGKLDVKESPKPDNSYQIDNFDVRAKIKQSLDVVNRQKEAREKLLEEKRKKEQEKLDEKKLEREKKLKPKKPTKTAFEEPEEKFKKPTKLLFEEKINTRKLTYIVGSDNQDTIDNFYYRKKKRKNKQHHLENLQKEYKKITREVTLPELISVADLADRMSEKAGDVVKKLFTMGVVTTSNQVIDADTAEIIIAEFGHIAKRVANSDVENILGDNQDDSIEKIARAPIVTIMGHVDHGKTSLLDAIRSTTVAAKEHGGITQHIGASRIQTDSGKFITFLDTPGHEAFTEMRMRGANVTDIVVLVVAADDGVKEQTIEAISHAKAANVPIIVAVNKIDKPGSDPDRVKNELLSYDIISEDLGGQVMFVPVSAKKMLNLDKLEEAILLQSEILELKATYNTMAAGVVIESKIDQNKGVVVTLLIQSGTLNIADIVVAGIGYGKIRKMSDEKGRNIKFATPSMPVEILGLDNAPNAGDKFFVVKEEKQARDIISYRSKKDREEKAMKNSAKSFSDIFKESGKGKLKYLNVIIKGDVHGSVEAIASSLAKLNTEEVAIKVVHLATGGITETDISLAAVSSAIIIGFNVRTNVAAKEMAKNKNVDIRYYSVIYNVVDDLKLMLGGMLEPVKNEEYLGQAEIRQVFKVTGMGKIAGSFVTDGVIKRGAKVRLLRDNVVIFDGTLKTLKRFKDDVKEVKSGFECGLSLENYDDIKEGDAIECYQINEEKRTL